MSTRQRQCEPTLTSQPIISVPNDRLKWVRFVFKASDREGSAMEHDDVKWKLREGRKIKGYQIKGFRVNKRMGLVAVASRNQILNPWP